MPTLRSLDYPSALAASDPMCVESVKIPRSVLTVMTVVGERTLRSRAFVIREALTTAAARFLEDAATKKMVEERERHENQAGQGKKAPSETLVHPASASTEQIVRDEPGATVSAPPITGREPSDASGPRYLFTVKVKYQDELEKPEGTRAEEPHGPGSLIIFDGESVVARYSDVDRWSRQRFPAVLHGLV